MPRPLSLALLLLLLLPATAPAIEYACKVEKRYDLRHFYTREQTRRGRFSLRIVDHRDRATLRHCAYDVRRKKIGCDPSRPVDKIEFDPASKSKKFYLFASQSEVQIFTDLHFVENNGRGGVSFGTCTVAPDPLGGR